MKIRVEVDLLGSLRAGRIPAEGPFVEFDRSQNWSSDVISAVGRYCKQVGQEVQFKLLVTSATPDAVVAAAVKADQRQAELEAQQQVERESRLKEEKLKRRKSLAVSRGMTKEQWDSIQLEQAKKWVSSHGSIKLRRTDFDSKYFMPLYRKERRAMQDALASRFPEWTYGIDVSTPIRPADILASADDLRMLEQARQQVPDAEMRMLGDQYVAVGVFKYSRIIFRVEPDINIDEYDGWDEHDDNYDVDEDDELDDEN